MALLAYNRKKQFLAPYVDGLIKQLTGFEEDDKNYQEVAKFVYSNLIHHNFATVDISAVKRSLEGIAEKFKIHGFNQRSRKFQELVDKYVNSDSSHHTQLNVQWNVLLLLLTLAYRPLSVSEEVLTEFNDVSNPSLVQDHIDWPEYLREGLEEFPCPSSSDDEDLWLSASEDEDVYPAQTHSMCTSRDSSETLPFGVVPHPSLWQQQPPSPSRQEALRRLIREAAQSELWLRNCVQNSWCCDTSHGNENKHSTTHMCQIWEQYKISKNGRDSSLSYKTQIVPEFKVLQEVLWMLQVSTETSLFSLNNEGHFYVKPNLSLSTTIPDTLQLILEDLCPYFDMINQLKRFEEELHKQELSENPPPVTYKAYCAALFQQLNNFNRLVIDIETKIIKQEETMTLVSVVGELMPGLNILKYMYDIHTRAVTYWHILPPWLCATRLLSVLYEALLEATDQSCVEVSLHLFIHSFHVYLDIIDVWLSDGRLEDWRSEFLVTKTGGSLEVMPYESEMRKCGVVPVSLLSKLVTLVRDAGRTMEVVSDLNKLAELRETVQNKGCLFKEFSENIFNEIKRLKEGMKEKLPVDCATSEEHSAADGEREMEERSEKVVECAESDSEIHNLMWSTQTYNTFPSMGEGESQWSKGEDTPKYLLAISNKRMYNQTMQTLLDDPLLSEALRSYFQEEEPHAQPVIRTPTSQHSEFTDSVSVVGVMSIHTVLEKQLELVVTRHKLASYLVTQTLRKEYNLLQHFTVLRTVFFMEAGNLAQSFYSFLFKEIEAGTWGNNVSLSVQLQLCVEEFYPGFGNYFTITTNPGQLTSDVHMAIPAISLAYKVDWPVSSVVTADMIESYNKVFRFLLHIKYAFWTLRNISFSDLASSTNVLRVRRLHILKMWMYHSTNTLHSYFMGLVLRSYSTHLEQSILEADSVDVIIQAHKKFLEEVKVHCLQDRKAQIETLIMKLLRLCSSLANLWEAEAAGSLAETVFSRLEVHYMTVYRGLVHCLEIITSDADDEIFLSELKNELAHSVPHSSC